MSKLKNITGETFGNLTVVKRVENTKHNRSQWLCRCSCDKKEIIVRADHLASGHTQSCGCVKKEKIIEKNITHGLSDNDLYKILNSMKNDIIANLINHIRITVVEEL